MQVALHCAPALVRDPGMFLPHSSSDSMVVPGISVSHVLFSCLLAAESWMSGFPSQSSEGKKDLCHQKLIWGGDEWDNTPGQPLQARRSKMLLEAVRPLIWGRDMPGALEVAWDQCAAVTGMRTDSNKTSDTLPLTPGKREVAQGS